MIEHLVPPSVRTRAAYGAELDAEPLHPEEAPAVARAVPKRRAEYAAGRACARTALSQLTGRPAGPLLRESERGAPRWPDGVVGSITHCDGYRAAAVARTTDVLTLGIDAEPHAPLPDGVLDVIVATDGERAALGALTARAPHVHWDRLLFSAKETVYKAWYPYHRRMLGFTDAELTFAHDEFSGFDSSLDSGVAPGDGPPASTQRGTYTARLLVPGPLLADGVGPDVFTGRWIVRDGFLATAITVPNPRSGTGA